MPFVCSVGSADGALRCEQARGKLRRIGSDLHVVAASFGEICGATASARLDASARDWISVLSDITSPVERLAGRLPAGSPRPVAAEAGRQSVVDKPAGTASGTFTLGGYLEFPDTAQTPDRSEDWTYTVAGCLGPPTASAAAEEGTVACAQPSLGRHAVPEAVRDIAAASAFVVDGSARMVFGIEAHAPVGGDSREFVREAVQHVALLSALAGARCRGQTAGLGGRAPDRLGCEILHESLCLTAEVVGVLRRAAGALPR